MNKIRLLIIMMILAIPLATALDITYLQPGSPNEVLTTLPQMIKVYVNDQGTITNCTINTSNKINIIYPNISSTEIQQTITLMDGTYTTQITCYNNTGLNNNATQTFKIDMITTVAQRNEKNSQYAIWTLIFIITIISYYALPKKQKTYKVLAAGATLAVSTSLVLITTEPIVLIPIGYSVIILLYELVN